jgi:RluA family pseudouridine synthase
VSADYDGATLIDFLTGCFAHHPAERWLALFDAGELRDLENRPASPNQIVRAGERFHQFLPKMVEPEVSAAVEFLHEDAAIIVLNKPAPLPMHPGGRFNRNTLQYFLNEIYHPDKLRPVHRLDANTSGLVVMARTRHVAALIQPQFIRGEVEKVYLAVVQGHPEEDAFVCDAPISDDAERLGSRLPHEDGQLARTEFTVLERREDGTALLEARPITGRTNQIRIHLWQLGYPILNDPTYLPHGVLGDQQTRTMEDPPMHLHAWKLAFNHPVTKERMQFEVSAPWLREVTSRAADLVH